jgi:hypothetical protein
VEVDEIHATDKAIAELIEREVRKVDGIRGYLRHCEVMEAAADEERQRQSARRDQWRRRAERVKGVVLAVMEINGLTALEGNTGTLRVAVNGGYAPTEIQIDVLPDNLKNATIRMLMSEWEYLLTHLPAIVYERLNSPECEVAPNMDLVRQALKDGGQVPGAHLLPRGKHVRVK